MTTYHVIVEGGNQGFGHTFDGEPQLGFTFEVDGAVYKVTTRAHDEDMQKPTLRASLV